MASGAVAGLFVLFQITAPLSTTQIAFNIPIGVQEMVLAIWLIVKGFSSTVETERAAH